MLMDTFIIVVMLCTWNPEFGQEMCTPMVESPKVYYKNRKRVRKYVAHKKKRNKRNCFELSNDGYGSVF